ncbi:MAG: hypothetical protein DYG89_44750 [Caldilinea sp. CFX5]|nr:hypothetical protein [Caldilinea sp. CFX5]
MARLFEGEKEEITEKLHRLLHRHHNGLRESEIAEMVQMDRRRVNNYLRELAADEKVYKDGWEWYAE